MFKSRVFEKALDRATSELLLEVDLEAMLQTCDEIRQKEVTPKSALGSLKRKLREENPHVVTYGLCVLECWMKNCGPPIHNEVGSRDFMEFLKDLIKDLPDKPRQKLLELIQTWSYAFKEKHRIVTETYNTLKGEGYDFPEFVEADTLFDAEVAPEWKDSNNCYHCRVEFGLITRKHHCRNCGEIFCNECTKKQCVIPRFGFEREVRVCDSCYDELAKKVTTSTTKSSSSSSQRSGSNGNGQDAAAVAERQKQREREMQLKEQEELDLALAISQSEYESEQAKKTKSKSSSRSVAKASVQASTVAAAPSVTVPTASTGTTSGSEASSELDRYLDRAYWERRQQQQQQVVVSAPSAPSPTDSVAVTLNNVGQPPPSSSVSAKAVATAAPNVKTEETEQFVRVLQTQIAAFLSRLKFDQQRGRDVTGDAAVQTQFVQLSRAHDVLLGFLREADDRRNHYESLQEKLVQLTDAREALDALRAEQLERRRRQAEEEEHQRRLQMASKLDYMRAKKHEYLEMQRRQALARLEEQQRDMALRLEQQKAMRQMQNPQMAAYFQQQQQQQPGGYFPPQMPGFPGQQSFPPGQQWNSQAAMQQPDQQSGNQQWVQQNPAQTQPAAQFSAAGANMQYVPPGSTMAVPQQTQQQPSLPSQVVPNPGAMATSQPPQQSPQPIYYQQQQQQPPPQQQQFPGMTMAPGPSPVPQTQQMPQQLPAVVPHQPPQQQAPPAVAELIQFD